MQKSLLFTISAKSFMFMDYSALTLRDRYTVFHRLENIYATDLNFYWVSCFFSNIEPQMYISLQVYSDINSTFQNCTKYLLINNKMFCAIGFLAIREQWISFTSSASTGNTRLRPVHKFPICVVSVVDPKLEQNKRNVPVICCTIACNISSITWYCRMVLVYQDHSTTVSRIWLVAVLTHTLWLSAAVVLWNYCSGQP